MYISLLHKYNIFKYVLGHTKQPFLSLHLASSLSTQRFTEITSFAQVERLLSHYFLVNS